MPFCINNPASADVPIQAYAQLIGDTWTYYLQQLDIVIGRTSESTDAEDQIDLDLGRSKTISRKHLRIKYNFDLAKWEMFVTGRNGVKLNSVLYKSSPVAVELKDGSILEIGGIQFTFMLPPSTEQQPEEAIQEPQTEVIDNQDSIEKKTKKKQQISIPKPAISYANLIAEAINASAEKRCTLNDICRYITEKYEYYKYTNHSWQNSIRHNLSLNKAFIKIPRDDKHPGKGNHWTLAPDHNLLFDEKKRKINDEDIPKKSKIVKTVPFVDSVQFNPMPLWNPVPFWGCPPFMFDPNAAPLEPHFPNIPGHLPTSIHNPVDLKPIADPNQLQPLPCQSWLIKSMPKEFFALKLLDEEPTKQRECNVVLGYPPSSPVPEPQVPIVHEPIQPPLMPIMNPHQFYPSATEAHLRDFFMENPSLIAATLQNLAMFTPFAQ